MVRVVVAWGRGGSGLPVCGGRGAVRAGRSQGGAQSGGRGGGS